MFSSILCWDQSYVQEDIWSAIHVVRVTSIMDLLYGLVRNRIKKFDMQSQSHPNAFKRCLDILLWFQTHLPVEISTRSMSTHPIPAKIGRWRPQNDSDLDHHTWHTKIYSTIMYMSAPIHVQKLLIRTFEKSFLLFHDSRFCINTDKQHKNPR